MKIGDAFFARESRDSWVNWKDYRELYEDASPSMLRATLQFVTATAFERRSGSLPLPDPQFVFRGYLDQWRYFSPVPFPSRMIYKILFSGIPAAPTQREIKQMQISSPVTMKRMINQRRNFLSIISFRHK